MYIPTSFFLLIEDHLMRININVDHFKALHHKTNVEFNVWQNVEATFIFSQII